MANWFRSLLILAVSVAGAGCALGPIYSHESARTVGDGGNEIAVGLGLAGYGFKYTRGLSDRFDLGVQWEMLSLGLRAKYGFVQNNSRGVSFAGAGGLGTSGGGKHYYGDLMLSYLVAWFEPYLVGRVVHVVTDAFDVNSDQPGALGIRIEASRYDYGQLILGARVWTAPHWQLTVEASTFARGDGVRLGEGVIGSLALGHRW